MRSEVVESSRLPSGSTAFPQGDDVAHRRTAVRVGECSFEKESWGCFPEATHGGAIQRARRSDEGTINRSTKLYCIILQGITILRIIGDRSTIALNRWPELLRFL